MKTYKEVISESKPSLVCFIHAGQQNAVEIKYNLEDLRREYGDKANILRVDASYDARIARENNLTTYPTYVLFKEGQELMRESGRKSVKELEDLISRAG